MELRLLDIERINIQNMRIIVIVNNNKKPAMIDISRKPTLEFGGAPNPTKKVLKIN